MPYPLGWVFCSMESKHRSTRSEILASHISWLIVQSWAIHSVLVLSLVRRAGRYLPYLCLGVIGEGSEWASGCESAWDHPVLCTRKVWGTVMKIRRMMMMLPRGVGLIYFIFPGSMLFGRSYKIALWESELEPDPKIGKCFLSQSCLWFPQRYWLDVVTETPHVSICLLLPL